MSTKIYTTVHSQGKKTPRWGLKSTSKFKLLRTEVRGDFNIYGTKYFQYAVLLQKSNIYDVLSLLNLRLAKKKLFLYMKYWHGWLLLKMHQKVFSVITSCVNISRGEQVFLAHQRFRRLTTSWFFDFWWKHPEYILFHWC